MSKNTSTREFPGAAVREDSSLSFLELLALLVLGGFFMLAALTSFGIEDPFWAGFISFAGAVGTIVALAYLLVKFILATLDLRDRLKKK